MLTYRILKKDEKQNILNEYHRMRHTLWPEHIIEELKVEMEMILKGDGFDNGESSWTVFVVEREDGNLAGFAEITIYPELSFCESKNIAYIEGWFIDEDLRGKGIGRKLIDIAEKWLIEKGSTEIASDVEEDNFISQKAHIALGFEQLHKEEDCFFYKKRL